MAVGLLRCDGSFTPWAREVALPSLLELVSVIALERSWADPEGVRA